MKKLLVLLVSATACAAQALPIGPFATESWVEERIQTTTNGLAAVSYVDSAVSTVEDKIPDVSGLATKEYVDAVSNAIPDTSAFSTVEYVNTTSNNLALLMDDLVSEEELGGSVSNIVPSWALVPVPPVTAEVDPIFTAWEGSNLYVRTVHSGPVAIRGSFSVGEDSNAFSNKSGTFAEGRSTIASSAYTHAAGWSSRATNELAWAWNGIRDTEYGSHGRGTFSLNPVDGPAGFWIGETNLATYLQNAGGGGGGVTKAYVDSHQWDWSTQITNAPAFPTYSDAMLYLGSDEYNLSIFPTYEDTTLHIGQDYDLSDFPTYTDTILYMGSEEYDLHDFPTYADGATLFLGDFEYNLRAFPTYSESTLYLGDEAHDLAGFITTESDPVFNEWTNNAVIVAGKGAMSVNGSSSTALGHNAKTYSYCTLAVGNDIIASNQFAVAVGVYDTKAIAPYATAVGPYNTASGESSTAVGMWTTAADAYSTSVGYRVTSHGPGTFNINPTGGLSGFWIGNKNLKTYLETMDNVLYKSTTLEGSESEFQSLKYYDLLDTFVGSRRANRYVSLYGALYVGEKADLVSTAFDPNPGGFTLSVGRGNTEAKGRSSVALGNNVTTADDDSFVTGYGGKVTGKIGFASGKNTRAKGNVSTATGEGTTAAGYASSSSGWYTLASAGTSQAHGKYAYAKDSDSWTWSAGFDATNAPRASLWTAQHADNIESLTNGFYESHGPGTFNIDPIGGTAGFWIGETNLATHLDNSSKIALDAIAPAFRASNVYTNGDCVIYAQHLYECTNYTGTSGWRAGDWQQTTVTGILGNLRRILDAINGEAL